MKKRKSKHNYFIDGEQLPQEQKHKLNYIALTVAAIPALLFFLLLNYLGVSLSTGAEALVYELASGGVANLLNIDAQSIFSPGNAIRFQLPGGIYILFIILASVLYLLVYTKLNYRSENKMAYGQKGDSRFTELYELREQYTEIPDRQETYPGIGGVPVSHYKKSYFIDTDTVNNMILGTSRSGKGELVLVPMIDILSRAQEQCSMVVNDPKGELLSGAKETLEKRGYDVHVLNIWEPSQSMSFDPLRHVVDAWLDGDEQEAAKRANSITFALYNKPDAGENVFFYTAAQNAVTAIILALLEHCESRGEIEKVTMHNVAEMLTELGTLNYRETPTSMVEKNALDEYFRSLPQGSVAKKRYGSTSFAGDRTRGSILAIANDGLQPFVDPLFAQMTSRNSLDLKSLGFPKMVTARIDQQFTGKRVQVSFHKNNAGHTLKGRYTAKVKRGGRLRVLFDEKLQDGDLLLIKYQEDQEEYRMIYVLHFPKEKNPNHKLILEEKVCTFPGEKRQTTVVYREKPIAVFMVIPDYDSSNHVLATIFVNQMYTALAQACGETKRKQCYRRVHFILDEFGNMPPLDQMEKILNVCLGRNMLFTLVVQSYNLIELRYGKATQSIKEGCQNHIYIMANSEKTVEEISKRAGHRTEIGRSSMEHHMELDNRLTKSAEAQRIITEDRLSQLIEGEMLVIRTVHRRDLQGRKVRPYPIFCTGETNMPYRHEFLSKWMDTTRDINEIDIISPHRDLDMKTMAIDFRPLIRHPEAQAVYRRMRTGGVPDQPPAAIPAKRRKLSPEASEKRLSDQEPPMETVTAQLARLPKDAPDRRLAENLLQEHKMRRGSPAESQALNDLTARIRDQALKESVIAVLTGQQAKE